MITIVVFLLIISVLVTVHELGHFIAAKRAGIGVEEFGLGLPPRLWGKQIGETIYSINWLPFGGFVKLIGEDSTDERSNLPNSFYVKSLNWRLVVVAAGVLMNFLLGVGLFYLVLGLSGFKAELPLLVDQRFRWVNQTEQVVIVGVEKGSPAEQGGLKVGDVVLAVNGQIIDGIEKLQTVTAENAGRSVTLEVRESGSEAIRSLQTTLREKTESRTPLGVILGRIAVLNYQTLPQRILAGFSHSVNIIEYSIKFFGRLIGVALEKGTLSPLAESVAGPVGIAAATGEVVGLGVVATLHFMALLSLNLAVLNVLPIPPFDGGKLFFLLMEGVLRRRIYPQVEKFVNYIGFFLIIILIALVTYNDILRLITNR